MSGLWESVTDLRQIESILLIITMVVPLVCGGFIWAIRHRVKTLQTRASDIQTLTYENNVRKLTSQNTRLDTELTHTRKGLSTLESITAPRQITDAQEGILVEKLEGVKAAPVIVSAYTEEAESASYGEEIASALKKAGWDVTFNQASMNDFKGISLGSVNLMQKPLTGLHELAMAFQAAHLDLRERAISPDSIAGPLVDGSLLVVVGRK